MVPSYIITPGILVLSIRDAVFIVSPKRLNLGSLLPTTPLMRAVTHHRSAAISPQKNRLEGDEHVFLQPCIWINKLNASCLYLTQGPECIPMRMTTGDPLFGIMTLGSSREGAVNPTTGVAKVYSVS